MIQSPDCSLSPESDLIPLPRSPQYGDWLNTFLGQEIHIYWSVVNILRLRIKYVRSHTGDNNQPVHCDYLSLMIPSQLSNHIKSNPANIKCE